MTESIASSNQPENISFQGAHSNSSTNNNSNNKRKQRERQSTQASSQNFHYSQRSYQHLPRYPHFMYYEEYYNRLQPARAMYYTQYHRPQQSHIYFHQESSSSPEQQRMTIRSNSNSLTQSNNEAENLRSGLIEQLRRNIYECMICIVKIKRDQEIWSCEICYKMFHLNCVRKWASSEESGSDKNWRCPGCQYSFSINPIYRCFCKKHVNPPFRPGEIPHSCGERCDKRLNTKSNDCNHYCSELCHPGPCPPCTTMIKRSCLCGRESRTVICSSSLIVKCENICGKLKTCQHHICDLICHPRECATCDRLIKQTCFSHGIEREILCSVETGGKNAYTCGELCGKLLSCGYHKCTKTCHDGPCIECSLLPESCKTCACGKTNMDNQQRTSCLDPLPTCEKICEKILSCGPIDDRHRCSSQCHNGPCPPCHKQSILQCRCGRLSMSTTCVEAIRYDPIKNPFCCQQRCNKKKLCGKHRCNEICCHRDVHVCEIICGKMLNCGIHKCEELCHKNLCRKCPINIYDEITCRCGQTVLPPPIECGTKPPICSHKCNRTHTCDHPVYHSCHDEDDCPPCTHLVSKMCVGEHTLRNNIPCYLKEVLCGQPCGKLLSCGVHRCQRACHSGPCQSTDQKCMQRCNIKRRECGHSCNSLCHRHEPCPATTCREIIKVRCPCGRLEKDVVCNLKPDETDEREDDVDVAQSLAQILSVQTIDLSLARKQQQQQQQQIECDDECRIIQRNKNLAQALSINLDEPRQSSIVYTEYLRDYARKNIEFVQTIERQFAQLVEETQRHGVSKRCHSFKPMKINERRLIHELAAFYGLETRAMDPEPHRNVVAYASFGMCKMPSVTLSETLRREKLKIPPPVPLV